MARGYVPTRNGLGQIRRPVATLHVRTYIRMHVRTIRPFVLPRLLSSKSETMEQ